MRSRPWIFVAIACLAPACTSFRDQSISPVDGSAGDATAGEDADSPSQFTVAQTIPGGETLTAIWGADADDMFAVGSNGLHYEYSQGTWYRDQSVLGRDLEAVWGSSPTDVYAVGIVKATGEGIVQHYDGNSWTDEYIAPTALYGVWGGGDVVLAVGTQGMVYGKDVGTTDWAMRLGDAGLPPNPYVQVGTDAPVLRGIAGRSMDDVAIAADLDLFFRVLDEADAEAFAPATDRTIAYRSVFATPGSSGGYVFGTSYFGVEWLAVDAGATTTLFEDRSPVSADQLFIYGIWGRGTQLIFTGDEGRIYSYDSGTSTFASVPSPTTSTLFGVWGSSPTDVWIVGEGETFLHGAL